MNSIKCDASSAPRCDCRWHRYTDAWLYGSGSDWQPQQQQSRQQHVQQAHQK
jgi:hypothetical protein